MDETSERHIELPGGSRYGLVGQGRSPMNAPPEDSRANPETTHFGFRDVPLAAKQDMVDDVFHSVANRYDLMNDLMSGGLHRAWKDALVSAVNPPNSRGFSLLDLAGGTGDVAFRVLAAGGPATPPTLVAIHPHMPYAR